MRSGLTTKFHAATTSAFVWLVVLSAIPFGSNRPWSWLLFGTIFASICIIASTKEAIQRTKLPMFLKFAVLLFAFFISINLLKNISPPLFGRDYAFATLLNIHEFETTTIRILSYGCVFWSAYSLIDNHRKALNFIKVVIIFGLCESFYALFSKYMGLEYILWYPKWASFDAATGTFVNRNHFGLYVSLCLMTTLSLLSSRLSGSHHSHDSFSLRATHIMTDILSPRNLWLVLASLIMLIAIMETGSRGAIISLVPGSLFLLFFIFHNNDRTFIKNLINIIIFITILIIIMLALGDPILSRITSSANSDSLRLEAMAVSIEAFRARPFEGWGLGSYPDLVEFFKPIDRPEFWTHAHSVYLEFLSDTGAVLTCIWFLTIALLCCQLVNKWKEKSGYRSMIITLSLGMTISVFTNSAWEFGLQIPTIAFLYAATLGVAFSRASKPWGIRKDGADMEGLTAPPMDQKHFTR